MIIVMKKQATEKQLTEVIRWIESLGFKAHPSHGVERTIIGVIGDERGKGNQDRLNSLKAWKKLSPFFENHTNWPAGNRTRAIPSFLLVR